MSAERRILALAAVLGFLGVAAGAFAAHGLKSRLSPDELAWWRTGVLYHLVHALAVLGTAALASRLPERPIRWAGRLFGAGVALFSGSLYAMALGAPTWLGAVTPVGGTAFLAGWVALGLGALRRT